VNEPEILRHICDGRQFLYKGQVRYFRSPVSTVRMIMWVTCTSVGAKQKVLVEFWWGYLFGSGC